VPCQEKYRVTLKWPGQSHDYIHANYIATPISDKRFICTQGPLDGTIMDFWHMTIQEESDSLVMLCNIKEKGMDKVSFNLRLMNPPFQCAQYWPLEQGGKQIYGDVEVTNMHVRPLTPEETQVKVSILLVRWVENGAKREREVRHYQWIDWVGFSIGYLLTECFSPIVAFLPAG
jgi:protein-tyrosine phosphatase